MFKKILIANRGEIAVRIIRACKEWGIQTVAIHSDVDKESMHVKLADESLCVGSRQPIDSYLNIPAILSAANITAADAIHPGIGFLSENAKFARMVEEHDLVFIGPSPEHIRLMGDKITAKQKAIEIGLPVVPGSDGPVTTIEEAEEFAAHAGYPILIKAASGGGGRGMKIAKTADELPEALAVCKQEALTAFGDDTVYIEKYLRNPRHIEVQIFADSYGNVVHLVERDCSIQRRHQKLTEEVPSPFMTDKLREKMGAAAVKAAEYIRYEGVGTVEFLVDKNRKFYFMEMNTRIQVEHPITEQVIDYDLIREQIMVAYGQKISGKNYIPKLHSIECRINACLLYTSDAADE